MNQINMCDCFRLVQMSSCGALAALLACIVLTASRACFRQVVGRLDILPALKGPF